MSILESALQGLTGTATMTFFTEDFYKEPALLALGYILPILHVATEIENERPRIAYLCRFYAFKKAYWLDPKSNSRGVWQFKQALCQRLERDNASSLASRVKETDALEIESFYQRYYEHYVRALDKGEQVDSVQLSEAYRTAGVLFEVLCFVNEAEKVEEVAPEGMKNPLMPILELELQGITGEATTMFFTEDLYNETVPSALNYIIHILRVATEIENKRPRVAYLCRFYAFKKTYWLDPMWSGRGVWQLKQYLRQRLERENASSLASRVSETDACEIESFYQQHYVRVLGKGDQANSDRLQLFKAYETAGVLFEVLCAISETQNFEAVAAPQIASLL